MFTFLLRTFALAFKHNGALTKRLCGGLQNRIEQFDSATHLTMKSASCRLSSTCGFLLFIVFPLLSVFPRHSYKALFLRHSYIASTPFLQCLNGILTLFPRHSYKTPIPKLPIIDFFQKKFEKYLVVSKKGCTFAPAFKKHAPVAQLVEHLTLNQGVQGSNPCGCTKRKRILPLFYCSFFLRKKNREKFVVSQFLLLPLRPNMCANALYVKISRKKHSI